MRGGKDKNGYHIISLTLDRKKYTRKVHRLVAQAFIPNPHNLPEVNHINGNKFDNRVTNLEWVSSAENTHHACETGLRHSKLDKGTVVAICKELEKGELRVSDIARKFDIFDMDVSKIRNGQTWLSISKYFDVKNCNFNRGLVGENNNNSSITSGIAKNVCELLEKGYTPTEISKKLNISRRIVYGIKYREAWNHISKDYSF